MQVSVLIMTYNHAAFIRRAVESALMQELPEDFEILISEDCSTDGTREMVQEYHKRFPKKIRLLLSEKNIRSNAIVVRGIEAAQGKYLALLDGDDYWLRPDKLRKQVEFLDAHAQCAVCFHNAFVQHEDSPLQGKKWTREGHPTFVTLEELWFGNFIATCSTMFRRGLVPHIPSWYNDFFPITDWPLHILNAEHGSIGYIDEVMGVYRHHPGGYYSPLGEHEKLTKTLQFYRKIDSCLQYRHHPAIQVAIARYFIEWTEEYLVRGDRKLARKAFQACLMGRALNRFIKPRRLVSNALKVYLPPRLLPSRFRSTRSTTASNVG